MCLCCSSCSVTAGGFILVSQRCMCVCVCLPFETHCHLHTPHTNVDYLQSSFPLVKMPVLLSLTSIFVVFFILTMFTHTHVNMEDKASCCLLCVFSFVFFKSSCCRKSKMERKLDFLIAHFSTYSSASHNQLD